MANRFQLWGQAGWASAEVVGETHYAKAIRALFGNDFDPRGTDITVPVQLIPDRSNRHDRDAVGVWSGSGLLGHLPRPEAARYVHVLTALTTRGLVPEVNARITGREWGAADGRPAAFDASIRLDLGEPHLLVPANAPPTQEHRLLPSGSAVQVVGQQQSLDALIPLLRPEGECWAYVTLHEMADHLVEVRIGDARVGDLSPKMSGELLPALRHMAEQGLVTAARAMVRGDRDKSEVMLYASRVQDLPESRQDAARRPAAGAAAGRGTASVAAPGVAGTGPAMPGANPFPGTPRGAPQPGSGASGATSASAIPGINPSGGAPGNLMSGGPASGGLVPNWVTPGEALPSWASPPTAAPSVASAPVSPATSFGVPSTPVSPAAVPGDGSPGEAGVGWAAASSGLQAGSGSSAPGEAGVGWAAASSGSHAGSGSSAPGEAGVGWAAASSGSHAGSGSSSPSPGGHRAGEGRASWATSTATAPADSRPGDSRPGENRPTDSRLGESRGGWPASTTTPVQQVEGRGSLLTDPLGAPSGAIPPVSPAPAGSQDFSITETTVIPALAAVVKANSGALAGIAPASSVPESDPHPPIPPAPTGIKFVVPPGWPTPPAGWYPPEGWRPDPGWPPAPAGWQWWMPTWD